MLAGKELFLLLYNLRETLGDLRGAVDGFDDYFHYLKGYLGEFFFRFALVDAFFYVKLVFFGLSPDDA